MVTWPNLPDGVIPIKSYNGRNGCFVTLTQELRQTAIEGDDFVYFDYDPESETDETGADTDSKTERKTGFKPIAGTKVEKPEDYNPNVNPERRVQDNLGNDQSYRVTLPRQLLQYDLGINIEEYNPDGDPFLLMFSLANPDAPREKRKAFALEPLGYASDVFRNPNQHQLSSPIPADHANEYAKERNLVPRHLRALLDDVAKWIDRHTLEALDIEPLASPTVIRHNGQLVTVEFLPNKAILERIAKVFDASEDQTTAIYNLHGRVGTILVREAYTTADMPIPDDHPLVERGQENLDLLVIPQPDGFLGLSTGVSSSSGSGSGTDFGSGADGPGVIPPVTLKMVQQVIGFIPIDEATLKSALSALTSELGVDNGQVTVGGTPFAERLREPVSLSFDPGYDIEASYDQVRIEFIPSGAGEKLAHEALPPHDVETDELAAAVQAAYNRQAEQLLRDADVDDRLAQFKNHADAVIIPVGSAP